MLKKVALKIAMTALQGGSWCYSVVVEISNHIRRPFFITVTDDNKFVICVQEIILYLHWTTLTQEMYAIPLTSFGIFHHSEECCSALFTYCIREFPCMHQTEYSLEFGIKQCPSPKQDHLGMKANLTNIQNVNVKISLCLVRAVQNDTCSP